MSFQVGQKLITKKTGLPITGYVVGIMTSGCWLFCNRVEDHPYWTQLYPQWKDKLVYVLWTVNPTKSMSRKEFLSQKESFSEDFTYDDLPETYVIAYPEDDLEPYHEDLIPSCGSSSC